MRLGKVVKSNSHCDYLVQLDDSMDYMNAPRPDDYGFGTFVQLFSNDQAEDEYRHWASDRASPRNPIHCLPRIW
jgi:hypothetical protein